MCFYYYFKYKCDNCGETLEMTTIKRRDCRKISCNGTVPHGIPVRKKVMYRHDANCSCHFPLVLPGDE